MGVEVDRFPDPLPMGHKKSSGEPVQTSRVEEEEEEEVEEEEEWEEEKKMSKKKKSIPTCLNICRYFI